MAGEKVSELQYLKGVGSQRAALLAKELDITGFNDLIHYFPYRYVDRSRFWKISEMEGEMPYVQIRGSFVNFATEGEGARKRLVGAFSDGHSLIEVIWFSKISYIRDSISLGKEYVLFGKPNFFRDRYSLVHPEVESYDPNRSPRGLEGVYTVSDTLRKRGLASRFFPKAMASLIAHRWFASLRETLPPELCQKLRLLPLQEALREMHFPTDVQRLQQARFRMKLEELFYLELHIMRYARHRSHTLPGHRFPTVGEKFNGFFHTQLPFELTGAQKRVIREIRRDMNTGRQMNRLLQGDVGSGKTMVAFMTMLLAVDNGFQAALMAPTEILATQHYEQLRQWCDAMGLNVRLLTGSTRTAERREVDAMLRDGSLHMIVGTHALLEEKVTFARLGLAVIDEQHRFGVAQRARLWNKNSVAPHVLVMTATPIPRTLAMTVYGDLDVSVIDELPPGRKPVETMLCYDDNRMEINRMIGHQLHEGRQVYIVYPLIHENEKLNLKSVETGYDRICGLFPDYKVCCVHGQMSPQKKDAEMQKFVSGEARIMVATTVIEVGVNVPNASVMVIENAERFGLSQLHQLRGRVGRGADRSYCILVSKRQMSRETRQRLETMTATTDGFLISEADMKLRGPGDMEGTQQSGLAFSLKVADLARDGQIVQLARDTATHVLDAHPELYMKPGTAVPDGERAAEPFLSPLSVSLLHSELTLRFAKTIDWSLIS